MLPVVKASSLIPRFIIDLMAESYTDLFGDKPYMNVPALNVISKDDQYLIELSVPGLEKTDLKLTLDDSVLEISAERASSTNNDSETIKKEFCFANFKRSYLLPNDAVSESIKATCIDGVLRITFQKRIIKKKDSKDISVE